jgi:hypothetical protein
MKLSYEQFDHDYIRVDLMPQRGDGLRVDVYTRALANGGVTVHADNVIATHGHQNADFNESWTGVLMRPEQSTTITYAGQSCIIRYNEDKKVHLSGNLPIAPYYNGLDPREIERMDGKWPEHLVIE